MSYSLIMCVIWILLQSPDLAIMEAAVGAGVTSILFFITLKKIRAISKVILIQVHGKDSYYHDNHGSNHINRNNPVRNSRPPDLTDDT